MKCPEPPSRGEAAARANMPALKAEVMKARRCMRLSGRTKSAWVELAMDYLFHFLAKINLYLISLLENEMVKHGLLFRLLKIIRGPEGCQ
jgi:hypothetical protein